MPSPVFSMPAGSGTRTHTQSPAADFESASSTNSDMPTFCASKNTQEIIYHTKAD